MPELRYGYWDSVDDSSPVPPVEIDDVGGIPIGLYVFPAAEVLEHYWVLRNGMTLDMNNVCPDCGAHLICTHRHCPAPETVRTCPNGLCIGGPGRLYEIRLDGLRQISHEDLDRWQQERRAEAQRRLWAQQAARAIQVDPPRPSWWP